MPKQERKNRITFFDATLREGGAERVISILSNSLVNKGYDVDILLYYDDEIFYKLNKNIRITSVVKETGTKNILKNIKYMSSYFKNNSDLIISFLAPFNMLSAFANRKNSIPIIVADRNDPRCIPNNVVIRKLRNIIYDLYADYVVLQTEHNKAYFNSNIQNKSVVIYNPIDLKENEGIAINTSKEKTIVSVGRLIKQKNQTMLIDAFKLVHDNHKDYKLVIYGEGDLRNELEEKVKTLNLEDSVSLPGTEKNIHKKIAKAKAFVLSSNYEGMPNALIEAMCLGLPCISTKVSGANELIEDGVNGYLVNTNDVNALSNRLEKIINDDKLANKLAKNASKLNKSLNIDVITDKWVTFINKVLK